MILLQEVGTNVLEKLYFEASYALNKIRLIQVKKWQIFWYFWNLFFPWKAIWLTKSKPLDWIYLMWSCWWLTISGFPARAARVH